MSLRLDRISDRFSRSRVHERKRRPGFDPLSRDKDPGQIGARPSARVEDHERGECFRRGRKGRSKMLKSRDEELIGTIERLIGKGRLPTPLQLPGFPRIELVVPRIGRSPGMFIKERGILVDAIDGAINVGQLLAGQGGGNRVQRLCGADRALRLPVQSQAAGHRSRRHQPTNRSSRPRRCRVDRRARARQR